MISKARLYGLVESITPPLIFRAFKGSPCYQWLVRNSGYFTSARMAQEVPITGGDLAGFKLKLDPNGPWQQEMISGEYDHELFSDIKKMNLSGKVMYDIGAHIGYHSLAFATYVGEKGHVFAFEPNPANVERAKEIIALNPSLTNQITVLNVALSDHTGTTSFLSTDDIEGGTSTGGFIDEASTLWERDRYIDKVGFKKTEVAIETIDALVQGKKILPPNFLKIDVEGAEQLVITGALQTLSTYHPVIIVEFHSMYSAYSCMVLLQKLQYETELLKREPDGRIMIAATYQS